MNLSSIPFIRSVAHPTDFSTASEKAFVHALAISLIRQTELTILNVAVGNTSDENKPPAVRKTLERWKLLPKGCSQSDVHDQLGLRVRKITCSGNNPTIEILNFLKNSPVDLVVLATEGREGLQRWVNRSRAEAIAHETQAISLFVPNKGKGFVRASDGEISLKKILIPIDHQPSPKATIIFAARAAQILGHNEPIEVLLLHVGEDDSIFDLELIESPTLQYRKIIQAGDPIEVITKLASDLSVDAIFMSTAGHEGLLDVMRGTTTEQVLRRSSCPILAIPQSWND